MHSFSRVSRLTLGILYALPPVMGGYWRSKSAISVRLRFTLVRTSPCLRHGVASSNPPIELSNVDTAQFGTRRLNAQTLRTASLDEQAGSAASESSVCS